MELDAQQKALADAHDGPALIAQRNGDVSYVNALLQELLPNALQNTTPINLLELGSLNIKGSSQDLEKVISKRGNELNISFQEPSTTYSTKVNFIVENSGSNDGSVVLLALSSDTEDSTPAAKQATTISHSLETRVLKQTARLAAQSEKRALVEEQAKLEAELKVKLIGNTIHHLNNPLNQIQGAFQLANLEIVTLRQTINELLQPEDTDDEIEALRVSLDTRFKAAMENLTAVQQASHRMADTIDILRVVSGIDGWSFRNTNIKEIADAAVRRLSSNLRPKIHALAESHGAIQLVGHPVIYAQAIEDIEQGLDSLGLEAQEIGVYSSADFKALVWEPIKPYSHIDDSKLSASNPLNLQNQSELQQLKLEVEHLLQAYKATMELTDCGIHVKMPTHHTHDA